MKTSLWMGVGTLGLGALAVLASGGRSAVAAVAAAGSSGPVPAAPAAAPGGPSPVVELPPAPPLAVPVPTPHAPPDPVAAAVLEAGRQTAWLSRVIARVALHEGRHDSVNRNVDGAGLSFGILQWNQRSGGLGQLLRVFHDTDPARFAAVFGVHGPALIEATRAGGVAPVAGAVLWEEPWLSRFLAAGRDPVFQAVQDRLAMQGPHMQGALTAARTLGFVTERSVALTYDTAVQQGPGFARQLAEKVRRRYAGRTVPMLEVLQHFAHRAPAHFRRTQPPTEPYPVAHIRWQSVGPSEWHAFAGRIDLYQDILRRRLSIVADPQLTDFLQETQPLV